MIVWAGEAGDRRINVGRPGCRSSEKMTGRKFGTGFPR